MLDHVGAFGGPWGYLRGALGSNAGPVVLFFQCLSSDQLEYAAKRSNSKSVRRYKDAVKLQSDTVGTIVVHYI